jgi:hypothetical protein
VTTAGSGQVRMLLLAGTTFFVQGDTKLSSEPWLKSLYAIVFPGQSIVPRLAIMRTLWDRVEIEASSWVCIVVHFAFQVPQFC